jgi:Ran GTPase-activating protein (RanGAP) involved in mRNA processing and transport
LAKLLSSPNGLVVLDVSSTGVNGKALKAIFEALVGNKTMRELHIGGNKLDSKALPALLNYLKANQVVRKLGIGGMGLAKDSLSQALTTLAGKTNLMSLDLSDTDMKVSARGLQNLVEKNNGLLELQLSNCNLSSSTCTAICNGMDKNTTLRR